jgi:hypothetical protein
VNDERSLNLGGEYEDKKLSPLDARIGLALLVTAVLFNPIF